MAVDGHFGFNPPISYHIMTSKTVAHFRAPTIINLWTLKWNRFYLTLRILIKKHLQLKGDRLAWESSLDSLKSFVMCDFQQQGKWTSPGGNMKQFKSTNKNLIINWYSKKQQTLCFRGRDGPTLKEFKG